MPFDLTIPLKPIIDKDPEAILDYPIDLTAWLDDVDDLLDPAYMLTFLVTGGVTVDEGKTTLSLDQKKIILWVSGGTARAKASATVHFKTIGLREDDRTIYFKMVEK